MKGAVTASNAEVTLHLAVEVETAIHELVSLYYVHNDSKDADIWHEYTKGVEENVIHAVFRVAEISESIDGSGASDGAKSHYQRVVESMPVTELVVAQKMKSLQMQSLRRLHR